MSALILSAFSNPTIIAVLAGLGGALVAFLKGRSSGAAKERQKHASERLRAREAADKVDDAISRRTTDENRQRLKEWSR